MCRFTNSPIEPASFAKAADRSNRRHSRRLQQSHRGSEVALRGTREFPDELFYLLTIAASAIIDEHQ